MLDMKKYVPIVVEEKDNNLIEQLSAYVALNPTFAMVSDRVLEHIIGIVSGKIAICDSTNSDSAKDTAPSTDIKAFKDYIVRFDFGIPSVTDGKVVIGKDKKPVIRKDCIGVTYSVKKKDGTEYFRGTSKCTDFGKDNPNLLHEYIKNVLMDGAKYSSTEVHPTPDKREFIGGYVFTNKDGAMDALEHIRDTFEVSEKDGDNELYALIPRTVLDEYGKRLEKAQGSTRYDFK